MALDAMLGGEGLETLEFSGFVLLRGEGELFAVGGGRGGFSHGRLDVCWEGVPVNRHSHLYDVI
jgi:hypothetical protein